MNSNNKVSDFLITVKDPSSDAAQQFSKTSMRIIKDGGRRVILVTSALPLEGKTFVAANLAASLARLPEVSAVLVKGREDHYVCSVVLLQDLNSFSLVRHEH